MSLLKARKFERKMTALEFGLCTLEQAGTRTLEKGFVTHKDQQQNRLGVSLKCR